jgi:hemerythrin-like metal-binding protein
MSFFVLNDGMSVGAHLSDFDHRALIAIINELHNMLEETDGAVDHAVLAKHFKELITDTQYHFSREESMSRAVNYEQLIGHAEFHGSFF